MVRCAHDHDDGDDDDDVRVILPRGGGAEVSTAGACFFVNRGDGARRGRPRPPGHRGPRAAPTPRPQRPRPRRRWRQTHGSADDSGGDRGTDREGDAVKSRSQRRRLHRPGRLIGDVWAIGERDRGKDRVRGWWWW